MIASIAHFGFLCLGVYLAVFGVAMIANILAMLGIGIARLLYPLFTAIRRIGEAMVPIILLGGVIAWSIIGISCFLK